MNLSYWEIKTWLTNVDFTVIGSGIVGLSCALELRQKYPKAKIIVLEKGILPQGASTKNAGFACFGSLSEIISDLEHHTEAEVLDLVSKRIKGLQLLRETLGDKQMDYKPFGGYELFLESDNIRYEICLDKQNEVNTLLKPIFKANVFSFKANEFGFSNIASKLSFNQFEGQIDTGKMMDALLKRTYSSGIKILNNCHVKNIDDSIDSVHLQTDNFEFISNKVLIATNGFASELITQLKNNQAEKSRAKQNNLSDKVKGNGLGYLDLDYLVKPARAQVLITKPIKNLHIKGTFHLDKGYYYFRNIDNRILFGGGRNLDFKGEETTQLGQTAVIQNKLEVLLKTTILPNIDFDIDCRWSGIMGVGQQKLSIIKQLSNNVFCGVRLGGMGIAIGSMVGRDLAELV